MRIMTIIFEDDEFGRTHTKIYEAGNGAGETEGEVAASLAMREAVWTHNAKIMSLANVTATDSKPNDLGISFEDLEKL